MILFEIDLPPTTAPLFAVTLPPVVPLRDRVRAHLEAHGPSLARDIGAALGVSVRSVARCLDTMPGIEAVDTRDGARWSVRRPR